MELLVLTGIVSLLFGSIAGSYFKMAAVNDEKIINSPLFRQCYFFAALACLSILYFYFSAPTVALGYTIIAVHLSCASVAFLCYSGSYFLSHSLCPHFEA